MGRSVGRVALAAGIVLVAAAAYVACAHELCLVRVTGGSMYPALTTGDVCLVRNAEDIRPGDIVLFRPPGHSSQVLHRVRSTATSSVVTQGDANPVPDFDPVPSGAVMGRVVGVVPIGRLLGSVAARFGQ